MGKAIGSIAMNVTFLLALSLLIFSIFGESRARSGGFVGVELSLECNKVHGVNSGDTCFDLANAFKLNTQRFNLINPNINCSGLFIGQWVCINGFVI